LSVVEVLDCYWSELQTQEPSDTILDRDRHAVRLMKDNCGGSASDSDISPATLRDVQRHLSYKEDCVSTVAIRNNSIRAILK